MKKIFAMLLALGLLAGFYACGKTEPDEPSTTAIPVTTEAATQATAEETTTTKVYPPPKPPETINTDYAFSSSYAKTPAYFFAMVYLHPADGRGRQALFRMPLSDLSKPREIPLPSEYNYDDGWPDICGITENELFLSGNGSLYRVPLKTLKTEKVNIGSVYNPWYNTASGSLIAMTEDYHYDENDTAPRQMKAFQPDTGESSVIMDDMPILNTMGEIWHNTADGMIALGGNAESGGSTFAVVDINNAVSLMTADEVQIQFRYQWDDHLQAQVGEWVYSLEYADKTLNLYRANADGTKKKLLRENTNIWQLYSVEGKLYCTALDITRLDEEAETGVAVYLLNRDGKAEKVLYRGYSYDTSHAVLPFYGMAMVKRFHVYGGRDGYFAALYNPKNDALFTD